MISGLNGGNLMDPPEPVLSRAEWEEERSIVRMLRGGAAVPEFSEWTLSGRQRINAMHIERVRNALRRTAPAYHSPPQRGEANPSAKLNETAVHAMRRLYWTGRLTQTELAAAYGVSPSTVNHIVHRKSWAHVPMNGDSDAAHTP